MQALEVIKIILGPSSELAECKASDQKQSDYQPSMTMFAAFDNPQWRTFRLRPRKPNCIVCGRNPSITAESIRDTDYETLCARVLPAETNERVSVQVLGSNGPYMTIRSICRYEVKITRSLMFVIQRNSEFVIFRVQQVSHNSDKFDFSRYSLPGSRR
jgi:hypothetical protein